MLVDFLCRTNFHLGQHTPTILRVVLGAAELNRKFGVHLDFDDIRYCYGLNQGKDDKKWPLRARINSLSLEEALGDSCKYSYDDIVNIKGNVKPDLENARVPSNSGHLMGI